MPLAFESLSHGSIAFGFFNIETDMLLLENYFYSKRFSLIDAPFDNSASRLYALRQNSIFRNLL
ncbi:MAG: hypothetical protein PVI71_09215 [Desulfobacterales bacterium]|jgi:hypothetical protein